MVAVKLPKRTEGAILAECRYWLRLHGWYVVRIQQGIGCHKGISDLIAIKSGRVVWVECKVGNGKQSAHQVQFETDVKQHGGEYVVARGYEDLERCL